MKKSDLSLTSGIQETSCDEFRRCAVDGGKSLSFPLTKGEN